MAFDELHLVVGGVGHGKHGSRVTRHVEHSQTLLQSVRGIRCGRGFGM
jgi:hypothetical protein